MKYPAAIPVSCALLAAAFADDATPVPTMGTASVRGTDSHLHFSLLPKAFQKNPELEMTVICELTDFGRTLPPVTPEHPAYYLAHDNGMKQLGQAYGGGHPPRQEYLDKMLDRSLGANGFQPADAAHPPNLVLFYTWGSHYALDKEDRMKFPELARQQEFERGTLLGGQSFMKQWTRDQELFSIDNSLRHQYLTVETRSDLYFVVVSAYDYPALSHGQRQLAWRAKLTVDAQGVAMDESLVPLVLTAAPYFGRDMTQSELVTRPVLRGSVKLAPLQILEEDVPAKK